MNMNEIPTPGNPRGIFDIFLPGAFLFLHVVLVLRVWLPSPIFSSGTSLLTTSPILDGVIVVVCFSYFIGMILRLLRTQGADRISSGICRLVFKHGLPLRRRWPKGLDFLDDLQPYFAYLDYATKAMPDEVRSYYERAWSPRRPEESDKNKGNRQFFNCCKTLVNAIDAKSSAEIFATEALVRYVSSMSYALAIASVLLLITACRIAPGFLLCVVAAYIIAFLLTLYHFKFLRFKEVEIVLVACSLNQAELDARLKTTEVGRTMPRTLPGPRGGSPEGEG